MAVYSENLCAMVVEFIKKEHTQKEESEVFGVSIRAISRWKKMYKKEKINLLRKSAKKA
ncbi:MAG: helix-turn-helix domain-containing protein [Alphaproteobacteria bacterium]|nr:helix-turn-helix domain-containing protein [Alphaproteobacteria bacterium]